MSVCVGAERGGKDVCVCVGADGVCDDECVGAEERIQESRDLFASYKFQLSLNILAATWASNRTSLFIHLI